MFKRVMAAGLVFCAFPAWLAAQTAKPSTPSSAVQAPTSSTIIRVPVNLVNVPLTVTDRKNRLVIMMTKDDFSLFEDGKPQAIQYFSRETDLALHASVCSLTPATAFATGWSLNSERLPIFLATRFGEGKIRHLWWVSM